jgi:hypothetical protein
MLNGGGGFNGESFEEGRQIVGRLFHPANGLRGAFDHLHADFASAILTIPRVETLGPCGAQS